MPVACVVDPARRAWRGLADARLEVAVETARRSSWAGFVQDDLDPVIFHETTDYGWRGLTQHGEVLEVRGENGKPITVPSEMTVFAGGRPIGCRQVRNDIVVNIDDYLAHFNGAVALYKDNRVTEALIEADATLSAAPTLRAKFNRAMILLALGRWTEGFEEYCQCEQSAPFMRPQVHAALDQGLRPWRGQNLYGKRLRVMHAHGFGDTIMMLRYLPQLVAMGAEVSLDVPPELQRLTKRWPQGGACDFFCPILHLLYFLHVTPENVDGSPYAAIEADLIRRVRPARNGRYRIGIAWSIGKPSDGDYPARFRWGSWSRHWATPSCTACSTRAPTKRERWASTCTSSLTSLTARR
jgi:hypothetical protein